MVRRDRIRHYIEQVSQGRPLQEIRQAFRKEFQHVPADEIAEAERLLIEEGMALEEVQGLCSVHAALFEGAVQPCGGEEPAGHPLFIFSRENEGLSRLLRDGLAPAFEAWSRDPEAGREGLLRQLRALSAVDRHYARKENLFFPYLEKAGVTAPPKVMWGVDDEIRRMIKGMISAVEAGRAEEGRDVYPRLIDQVSAMITKEEEILKPLLRKHMDAAAFAAVARESAQIGFAFADGVEGASLSDSRAFASKGSAEPEPRGDAPIQLPSGCFQPQELTALLNALPCDITFVAADDRVRFFSEQPQRVFPRTRTIIGRRVADCHPPKSLEAVEKLIQAFREGRKDSESYWIQRGGKFILIRYVALRDEEGRYLGVLECTEEISQLRALEGEKTLMS